MRSPRAAALLVFLFCAPVLYAQSAVLVQKSLSAESERLKAWTTDRVLIDAIKAQNARKVPLREIQRVDEAWKAGTLRPEVLNGACADRLRELAATKKYYVELFVMDNQGALVCANEPTTDYWQGDEPKWSRAFNGGRGRVFIDRPRYDESAKATLGAISLPILDGPTTIGVIMVGVITEKLPSSK